MSKRPARASAGKPASTGAKQAASPYSTGGGGGTLESRVGARYLALLLAGETAPELEDRAIVRLRFQQAPQFPIDDFVIEAARPDETTPSLQLAVAVRRAPQVVPSDEKMQELVVAFMQMPLRPPDAAREERIALVVAGSQTHAAQLEELASLAKTQTDAEGFFALIAAPGKFSRGLRDRLQSLSELVGQALAKLKEPSERAVVERRTWELLVRLRVVMSRLEEPDVSDWVAVQNQLVPITRGANLPSAERLRDRLEVLAADFRKNAASVDLGMVRRAVHPLLEVESWRNKRGWAALRRLEAQAIAGARGTVGVGERTHHVDRAASSSEVLAAASAATGLIVFGESGVGKSDLVLAALSAAARADPDALQVLCLNLRQLPESAVQLEHALGSPVEGLLAEMSAPRRMLVIDAAESATERKREMLVHLLNAARLADVKVIAITLSEVQKVIHGLLVTGTGGEVADHQVSGLTNAELDAMAATFPPLARLVANPLARELLRRLVVIDLLVRSNVSGMPVTEADAMREIWDGLVRRRDHPERGLPDARDHLLIRLATQQLRGTPATDLVGELDAAALDGLRRDGLLQPPADNPWQPLPEFSHDEVRRYAVARVLLQNLTPANDLLAAGAPRWALAAARVACQALLALRDSSSNPIQGRLSRVQAAFDALDTAGHGARWRDLPAEALLTMGEPRPLLADAWPQLRSGDAEGLRRLLRVVDQHHRRPDGAVDRVIVEPIVELLLDDPRPWALGDEVAELLRDWLRGLALEDASAGQPLRNRLRERLVAACAAGDADLVARREAAAKARAARTPEEIERETARRRKHAGLLGEVGFPRSKRRARTDDLPAELRNDMILELLALLGADLGESGEALLRRVAREEPWQLAPAVDAFLTGRALVAYGRDLLPDLTQAYYLDDEESDWSPIADGIRDHSAPGYGLVLMAWYRGPFMALFQHDFRRGVIVLNRLLNHAAQFRARTGAQLETQMGRPAADAANAYTTRLEVTGVSRDYVGDDHVWRWYRGSGVGPYPCMSALQALERVCDYYIVRGAPLERLVPLLLDGCENLAMLGLVVGILVRHIEKAGTLLDPYLAEPVVWNLEVTRRVAEFGGLIASSKGIEGAERREWTLREAAASLAINADAARAQQLRALGDRLVAAARSVEAARAGSDAGAPSDQPEELQEASFVTTVRGWASALDRDRYALETRDGATYLQNILPEDVQAELEPRNQELLRSGQATRLINRYAHMSLRAEGLAALVGETELAADLETAKDLVEHPPVPNIDLSADGPVAVAAAALEANLLRGVPLPDDVLRFAVETILSVAEGDAAPDRWASEDSYFEQGADRSAARALPLLLLPVAAKLREGAATDAVPGAERVTAAAMRLARALPNETRLHLARGLDRVWEAPCHGTPCIHEVAWDLVVESMRDCALGPWDQMGRRLPVVLDDPVADTVGQLGDRDILISRLDAAIRALGVAATRQTCVRDRAQRLLAVLLATQRRVLLKYDRSIDARGTHALVTARALLMFAAAGDPAPLGEHIAAFADRPDLLGWLLLALAAAAEETPATAEAARQGWPRVIAQVLALESDGHRPFGDDYFGDMALSALVPAPTGEGGFLYREIATTAIPWFDVPAWRSAIESWLPRAVGCRDCADSLVALVRTLPLEDQVAIGLPWVSQLVLAHPEAVRKRGLTTAWLIEIRPSLTGPALTRWQQLVDALVVAGDANLAPYSQ